MSEENQSQEQGKNEEPAKPETPTSKVDNLSLASAAAATDKVFKTATARRDQFQAQRDGVVAQFSDLAVLEDEFARGKYSASDGVRLMFKKQNDILRSFFGPESEELADAINDYRARVEEINKRAAEVATAARAVS